MKYGFIFPGRMEPAVMVEAAREAEAAGWDGIFYWDGIVRGERVFDPWAVLAAIALRTERIRLGAVLVPLPWRKPWLVARAASTVDHLSNGRLILPVGLGAVGPDELEKGHSLVGEPVDRRARAELLDEGLAVVEGLWTGEPFSYEGKHYRLEGVAVPAPVQRPRVPIWVVGAWGRPASMRRVERCDGWMPANVSDADLPAVSAYLAERRATGHALDLVWEGRTAGDDPSAAAAQVRRYAEVGATWWLEAMWSPPNAPDDVRRRIGQGPPRVD